MGHRDMYLIHVDESGTNYKKADDDQFVDGPIIVYGGVFIHDAKYHHLERIFSDLVRNKLGIEDWREKEIHAHELWQQVTTQERTGEDVRSFFEELLQVVSKLACPVGLGIVFKKGGADAVLMRQQKKDAVHSLIRISEYMLAAANENGILICDKIDSDEDDKRETEKEFSKILADSIAWRSTGSGQNPGVSKYEFESRIVFLISNLHYVSSKESLMIQLTDCILWVIRRMFTYYSETTAEPLLEKCPVTEDTFRFFLQRAPLSMSTFIPSMNDFMLTDFGFPVIDVKGALREVKEKYENVSKS